MKEEGKQYFKLSCKRRLRKFATKNEQKIKKLHPKPNTDPCEYISVCQKKNNNNTNIPKKTKKT